MCQTTKVLGLWSKLGGSSCLSGATSSVRETCRLLSVPYDGAGSGFHSSGFLVSWVSLLRKGKGLGQGTSCGNTKCWAGWNVRSEPTWEEGECGQTGLAGPSVGLHLLCPLTTYVCSDREDRLGVQSTQAQSRQHELLSVVKGWKVGMYWARTCRDDLPLRVAILLPVIYQWSVDLVCILPLEANF